jgi:uncharacterized protein
MIRIGVISDTHNHFDPAIPDLFQGVNHIIHAGDIGLPWILLELECIAPVTAVGGNTDTGLDYKETAQVQLDGRKFLVHHKFDLEEPEKKVAARIIRQNPDVVIFGHTHKQFCEARNGTLYFNPGYAGKKRFKLPRSVAILTADETGITADFIEL